MNEDQKLQLHFMKALSGAMPDDDCPDPMQLLDGLEGRLEPKARDALLDHIAGCPVCAEAWRLAMIHGTDPTSIHRPE